MNKFPDFMKSPANLIGIDSQFTDEIEGYVVNGADGSQMAFWTCFQDRNSKEHTHDFDEYFGPCKIDLNLDRCSPVILN